MKANDDVDIDVDELDRVPLDEPVVIEVPEVQIILASERDLVEMRARSAQIDLRRRRAELAARAPQLLAALSSAAT